jgi:putative ABC transport system substrate-binding protein
MRCSTVGFLVTLSVSILMAPLAADAQLAARVYRIGVLWPGTAASISGFMQVFRQELREHGWIEGQNLVFEQRVAEGNYDRLADLATELVGLKVDVLVARSTLAARAAQQATQTIPIVMTSGDPIGTDMIAGLARPGGNITGLTFFSLDLVGKRLELLKELVPGLTRVAVLWDLEGPSKILEFKEAERLAPALGMQLHSWGVRAPHPDLEGVFQATAQEPVGAVLMLGNPLTGSHGERIVALAARHQLPAMYDARGYVAAGGLISYGPNLADYNRRIVYYVDRILKGVKPAELPVEQPTRFSLAINLKTARALGLTIPPHILASADEVIQ